MNLSRVWIVSLALFSTAVAADEQLQFYRGVRNQAMGGASIGVVDDHTALLLNPAAMAKLREPYINVADPVLDIGSKDDQIAGGYANLPKLQNPQTALTQCNANPGSMLYGMGEVFPAIVFPNFGIGVLGRESIDAQTNTAKTAFSYNYDEDFAFVTGIDFRFFDGMIKFGANARLIDRSWIAQDNISPAATNLTTASMLSEGMGIGSDVGLIMTAPIVWLPSLAGVVRDVGGTGYTLRKGLFNNTTTDPTRTPQTMNGAFTIEPILGNQIYSLWTVEYDDISNATKDTVTTRHYHGGFEINLYDAFFLRGGYNEGYWTAGIELAIGPYQFQATSYGEEVGTLGALQEDRRYMGGFAIRF